MPENLFLAYQRGAGRRYYDLALQYLDDKTWFDPLSRNENVLDRRHAYSYVNSLSSATMAYLMAGSEKHLRAARNGFAMLQAQSYATGGWGPDETLRAPGSNDLYDSLTNTHQLRNAVRLLCALQAHALPAARNPRCALRRQHGAHDVQHGAGRDAAGGERARTSTTPITTSTRSVFTRRRTGRAARARCPRWRPIIGSIAYFRAPQAVYVNLYVPSTLRWNENGAALSLTQESEYPYEDRVAFTLTSPGPADLTLNFRIPAWAEGAQIFVNGTRQNGVAAPGQFAAIRRTWKSGDRVELELPLKMRLEPLDARHSDTVALMRGPLVLMAVKEKEGAPLPQVTRAALLGAKRVSQQQWQVTTANGPVAMLPFTWLGSRPYSTYLRVNS